ncbi:MAG TPA: beta-ketoacyl-ACP synthase III [Gemmatimonadota bacterium]|nr:beta-ketoacyl-ACP synthase III [Gemmatimonadota bacterium]
MTRTEVISTGYYVPDSVITNHDLEEMMDTSDEWIRQRSGISERRWVEGGVGSSDLALAASQRALAAAGMEASELDALIVATLSPDVYFPGSGVFLQRKLEVSGIPCLDVRNQCSGFIYGLSVADAWIRAGVYKRILLVGSEVHSTGLVKTTEGRDTAVLFGDGAGAAILGPTDDGSRGVLSINIHADGKYAEKLWMEAPGSRYNPWLVPQMIADGLTKPIMEGREVFKHASVRMPQAVREALDAAGLTVEDVKLVIPHQANYRITQAVQKQLGLPDEKVMSNIHKYGNTTAASIPIALHEAVEEGRVKRGDVVCLTAFGSGFTWGAALIRW